jgi:hypothetical protein
MNFIHSAAQLFFTNLCENGRDGVRRKLEMLRSRGLNYEPTKAMREGW